MDEMPVILVSNFGRIFKVPVTIIDLDENGTEQLVELLLGEVIIHAEFPLGAKI